MHEPDENTKVSALRTPEQWHWVWNHYVRHTMSGGAESPSTTPVILIAKQGQLFSSWETIISSMFRTLVIIFARAETQNAFPPCTVACILFFRKPQRYYSLFYKIQTNVTKSPQTFFCKTKVFGAFFNPGIFVCWSIHNRQAPSHPAGQSFHLLKDHTPRWIGQRHSICQYTLKTTSGDHETKTSWS